MAGTSRTADVLVIGWGLAGLVAAAQALDAGKTVAILDQEPRANLGGQAWWSFGGLLLVDSPEQRRMGIKDSLALARQGWFETAGFDREEERATVLARHRVSDPSPRRGRRRRSG